MIAEPRKNQNVLAADVASAPPAAPRRRRLLGAAGGGVGVLLAVQAKTALGQTVCTSMSGQMSGNTSPHSNHEVPCASGRSPGFWRQPQHFSAWVNVIPPELGGGMPLVCESGQGNIDPSTFATRGTSANSILPGAVGDDAIGVWEVLAFPSVYDSLVRHLLTAWLNAQAIPNYPLTPQQIGDIWTQLGSGGTYCPPNITCDNGGMTRVDVVVYIESTYGAGEDPGNEDACTLVSGGTSPSGSTGPSSHNGNGPGSNNGGGKGGGKGTGGT